MKNTYFFTRLLAGLFATIISFATARAQTWDSVGHQGFSAGVVGYPSMAIDHSGTPYVAFVDYSDGDKATVMKYNGSNWVLVGARGFSTAGVTFTSIAIDTGGTPYVAYQDEGTIGNKATVMKFNGTSWVTVGTAGFTAGYAYWVSIAIDGSGTPYVAYQDYSTTFKANVMKFNGTSWASVGSANFSADTAAYESIAIDGSGVPYVAYTDYGSGQKVTVMKFDGTGWVTVGSAGCSAGASAYPSLALDPSGTPYVAYEDYAYSQKATVIKFNGTSWVNVGSPGFSAGVTAFTSLATDWSGTPYLVYQDFATLHTGLTCQKFNGSSWDTVGHTNLTPGQAEECGIVIPPSGIPYVVYQDFANSIKASVLRYPLAIAPITGANAVCEGLSATLSDATPGGTWSSSDTSVATIGSGTGVFVGLISGTFTITYDVGGSIATYAATVNPIPDPIVGITTLCLSTTSLLMDIDPGVTWSSSNSAVASVVSATGLVDGVSTGSAVITYTLPTGCYSYVGVTVYPNPAPPTGITNFCVGGTRLLLDVDGGGTWSSSDGAIFSIGLGSGIGRGVSAGVTEITYTLSTGCFAAIEVTVTATPSVIAGADTVCTGVPATLSNTAVGGSWSSANTAVGTINAATGVFTGIAAGSTVITYTTGGLCTATRVEYVLPSPAGIIGVGAQCIGSTTTVTDGVSGGLWTSSNAAIASVSSSGLVVGHTAGTAVITYSIPDGCFATFPITIVPAPGPITGRYLGCLGSATALGNSVPGGTWTSSNSAVAVIGSSTGVYVGVGLGTAMITYSLVASCRATHVVTIEALPSAISGPGVVCQGAFADYSDTVSGGAWSSSNPAVGSISTAGLFSGISVGTTVVTYSISSSCPVLDTIAVNPLPAMIAGPAGICSGSCVTYSDATPGGVWSCSSTSVATIGSASGILCGVSSGTVEITYNMGGGCAAVGYCTVYNSPSVPSGPSAICVGSTVILRDFVSSGAWSSGNTAVATIGSITGLVSGVSNGTSILTYTAAGGCFVTDTLSVSPSPGPISGPASVCAASPTSYSNTVLGGLWTSSNPAVATIGSASAALMGVSSGTVEISYTMGSGCAAIATVEVFPALPAIGGSDSVCAGSTTDLSSTVTGGWFSSSDTSVATIGSASAVLMGISAGTDVISYSLRAGCYVTKSVAVASAPDPIVGGAALCVGTTSPLSDGSAGGSWMSANAAIAGISSATGVVTGISSGTTVITYLLGDGCRSTYVVSVNPVDPITGPSVICDGLTGNLANIVSGGTWTSSNTAVATVGLTTGMVNAVSDGTTIITYTTPAGCTGNLMLTVVPHAAAIGSVGPVCTGMPASLTDADAGGSWSSNNTAVASIGSGTGLLTGVAAGTSIITYSLAPGCYATTSVAVIAGPPAISGPTAICVGATATYTDGLSGGTWSSSTSAVASIGSGTGALDAVSAGSSTITYKLPDGCYSTRAVNVYPAPGLISTAGVMCAGSEALWTDAIAGGEWISGNPAIAAVGSGSGIVTAVSSGTTTITYSMGGACSAIATVDVSPALPAIAGSGAVCAGSTTNLSITVTGGVFSSNNTSVATIGASTALCTGVSAGTTTISYVIRPGCYTTRTETVSVSPGPVTGPAAICAGSEGTLEGGITGGVWSSSGGVLVIGSATGIISGSAVGTSVVTYSLGACTATAIEVVNAIPVTISGAAGVCAGNTTDLLDASSGGTWSSSNPSVASIGSSSGIATGVAAGTVTITYTLGDGCATTVPFAVTALPLPITGTTSLCSGTTSLADVTTGGTWFSSNVSVAAVDTLSGIVTALLPGTATISYAIRYGCSAATTVTVIPGPAPVGGYSAFCAGAAVAFTDATAGGIWSSSNTAVASIGSSGLVIASGAGTAIITYAMPGLGCMSTLDVSVLPALTGIIGTGSLCTGSTEGLIDMTSGGVWTTSNAAIATIGSTGIVSGVAAGTAVISYHTGPGCITTSPITIDPLPAAITGATNLCAGGVLADATPGGAWSSGNTSIATIGTTTGIVSRVSAGTTTITYTVATGCRSTLVIAVNTLPVVEPLHGITHECIGTFTLFADSTTGGRWASSDSAVAIADSNVTLPITLATVSGFSGGVATISYSISNVCGVVTVTLSDTVMVAPVVPAIAGADSVCPGDTVIVTDSVAGGTWLSSDTTIATIDNSGNVIGIAPGTATISYVLINDCGLSAAALSITVNSPSSCNTGVKPVVAAPAALTLEPNPNNGSFVVKGSLGSPNDEVVTLELTDMLGQVVHTQVAHAPAGILNARVLVGNALASGVYILSVHSVSVHQLFHVVIGQ